MSSSKNDEYYFVNEAEGYVNIKPKIPKIGKKSKEKILFGTKLEVNRNIPGDECEIKIRDEGEEKIGYRKKEDLDVTQHFDQVAKLKLYFIDVGQGDAILIQTHSNKLILIDGGRGDRAHEFITKNYNLKSDTKFEIDTVITTHADEDHYGGLVKIFNDKRIFIKNIYHNGIAKFNRETDKIGRCESSDGKTYLVELFDDINYFNDKKTAKEFSRWTKAIGNAKKRNHLVVKRVDHSTKSSDIFKDICDSDLSIKILGPINYGNDRPKYLYHAGNDSTINGNSVALLLKYKDCKILLCGDMNEFFEEKFLEYHKDFDGAHVFKASHHGSQEFYPAFLQTVAPSISVISSGDEFGYAHPRANLLACLGKYAHEKTEEPVILSTKVSVAYSIFNLKSFFSRKLNKDMGLRERFNESAVTQFWNIISLFWKKRQEKPESESESYEIPKLYEKSHNGTIFIRTDGHRIVAARIYGGKKHLWDSYFFTIDGNRLIATK